jgi:hypothetical protein
MADNILNIDELIAGDGDNIDKIIVKLEKLNSVYDVMVNQATARSKEYAEALSDIQEAANKLEKSFSSLDVAAKKDQDALSKGSSELETMVEETDAYNEAIKKTESQIESLIEQQKKLQSENDKLKGKTKEQTGSLDDLRAQLKQAEKDYKSLGTATSQAVKDDSLNKIKSLSRAINEQDSILKQAKKGVDVAKGSYQELTHQVNKAKAELKALEGGIGSETEEFKKLQTFVAKGTAQLKEFDEAIGDNQRDVGNYEKAVENLGLVGFGGLVGFIKSTGKELIKLSTNPFFITIAAVVGAFKLAQASVSAFFETTAEGEDILDREKAVFEAFTITVKKSFADAGKSIVDFFGGIKNILGAIVANFAPSLLGVFLDVANKGEELAAHVDELGDEIIQNIVDRANRELAINKLLEASKNTLLYTDEQRLLFLKAASTQREAALRRELELAQKEFLAVVERFRLEQGNAELIEANKRKQAEAAAKIIDLESQFFQEQKKNTAQISALTIAINKQRLENAQRLADAEREINKAKLQDNIDTQKKILDEETSSLTQRFDALMSDNASRLAILQSDKEHELEIVRRAAENERSIKKLSAEEILAQDKILAAQEAIIIEKYADLVVKTNDELNKAAENNFFKVLARDAAIATAHIEEELNQQLTALNDAFGQDGESIKDLKAYEEEKLRIQEAGQRKALLSQLDFLRVQVEAVKDNTVEKAQLLDKIAKVEYELSAITTNNVIKDIKKREEAHQKLVAAVYQLQAEAFSLASTLVNADVQKNVEALDQKLSDEEKFKEDRLKIVGDDKQAQALIEQDFANKQAQIQLQINEQKRKAAVFDKALQASQIIVNTARAVTATLPAVPLSIVIGAIGALQLAKVLATPIPSFFTGVDSSPEGIANLGEKGRELAVGPDGTLTMYNKPTKDYLLKGTRVFNNEDTEAIADLLGIEANIQGQRRDAILLGAQKSYLTNDEIVSKLNEVGASIVDAVRSQPSDYYDEFGFRRYENSRNGRIMRLDDKYKFSK